MTDRRYSVPFDPDYFARRAAGGQLFDRVEAFRHAYRTNLWAGPDSRSGPGSGLEQTGALRTELPSLLRRHRARSMLDLPCGDWRWMATVPLSGIEYTGGDLLEELVVQCHRDYAGPHRSFLRLDLTTSSLPAADLLLCRDCLVHLSIEDIRLALANIRRSDITWLLTTTFPGETVNRDIVTGDWRPLNFQIPPFNFPEPLELIDERCTEGAGRFSDKSLGLWRVRDLPT